MHMHTHVCAHTPRERERDWLVGFMQKMKQATIPRTLLTMAKRQHQPQCPAENG